MLTITEEGYYEDLVRGMTGKGCLPIKAVVAFHEIQSDGVPIGRVFYSYEGNWVSKLGNSKELFEVKVLEGLEPFKGAHSNTLTFTKDSVKDKEWAIENSPHKVAKRQWEQRFIRSHK